MDEEKESMSMERADRQHLTHIVLLPHSFVLLRLQQKQVEITFDQSAHEIREADTEVVADDVLTALFLYRFSREPLPRLVISRPSASGISLLRENRALAMSLIREFPPRHYHAEFGVPGEVEDALRLFVNARRHRLHGQITCAAGRLAPGTVPLLKNRHG